MITVIGEINADTFQRFADKVEEDYYLRMKGDPPQFVLVSSPGGDIGYTLAMLDEIDNRKRQTMATGVCQSAAAVLATAGEGRRTCTMDTLFRFIPPETEHIWDSETKQMVDKVPDLRYYLHSIIVARLAQRLKREKIEVLELFDGEFISSTRALELGLVDEVISTEEPNGNSNRLSGSAGEAAEPADSGYDDYAPSPNRCGGDIRVQQNPEEGQDSNDFGWPV